MIRGKPFTTVASLILGAALFIPSVAMAQPATNASSRPADGKPSTSAPASQPAHPASSAAKPKAPVLSEDEAYERAVELIAAARQTERWLDEKKSIRIQATKVWTATEEGKTALTNEPPRTNLAHPLMTRELFLKLLPRIEEKIEVAWDEKRVARFHEIVGEQRTRWVYDGKEAVIQARMQTGVENVVLDNEPELISASILSPFMYGRAGVRKAWWSPAIPASWVKYAQDTVAQYKYLRSESFRGAEHYVLGTVENEWWIDAKTNRVSMYRNLQTVRAGQQNRQAIQQASWAFLRSKGYPVNSIEEDTKLSTRLSKESPEIFKALQRSITEALIRKGLIQQFVVDEFQLLDYKEVAPGCFWPMRQVSRHNSALTGREGLPLLQSEIITTLIEVEKPIPESTFAVRIAEGSRVEDFREDIKLTYFYKANRTEQEWEIIRNARKAELEKKKVQEKKLQDLLGKPSPEPAAAYWVNSDPLTIKELSGRFILLYFWADWYPLSMKDFPQLEQIHLIHGHTVKLITVHAPTPLFRSFFDSALPTLVDFSETPPRRGMLGETAFRFGVTELPYSILIGPEGTVLAHGAFQEVYKQLMRMMLPKPGVGRPGGGLPTPPRPGGQQPSAASPAAPRR